MTDKTDLGNRMKRYEEVEKHLLPHRVPVIIRVDGKSFSKYTKGFKKPYDDIIQNCMTNAAIGLLKNIQGAELAYIQSDEISVLLNNFKHFKSQAWFDNKVQKMASVSASIATAYFNEKMRSYDINVLPSDDYKTAFFDSRCFTLPSEDVVNAFLWRQRDAIKNSVSMLAQQHFSHKKLKGQNGTQKKEMLSSIGVNWKDTPLMFQRGWCVKRKTIEKNGALRGIYYVDDSIPLFSEDKEYINKHLEKME